MKYKGVCLVEKKKTHKKKNKKSMGVQAQEFRKKVKRQSPLHVFYKAYIFCLGPEQKKKKRVVDMLT